ncbi:hypothetical protein GCK72_008313 [Caenorhabditis remanei]|uniref:Uncharacterized protein n=2 Tax=Caenorhabditis remanei TaxID=31234 RepID=A0A6A5GY99_CAERE|nr:hypothetical protein GCK72_008313 [Caenorhabditis remanei]KAF1760067.1 hypothetical protein GCK72_008313 [Caenorhabditis remanei]
MNALSIILLLLSVLLVNTQFQPRTSNRRVIFRPMTRNSGIVGRGRGPVAPAPFRNNNAQRTGIRAPGFKPPVGIAKKLNEAVDFRALARVLLKQ